MWGRLFLLLKDFFHRAAISWQWNLPRVDIQLKDTIITKTKNKAQIFFLSKSKSGDWNWHCFGRINRAAFLGSNLCLVVCKGNDWWSTNRTEKISLETVVSVANKWIINTEKRSELRLIEYTLSTRYWPRYSPYVDSSSLYHNTGKVALLFLFQRWRHWHPPRFKYVTLCIKINGWATWLRIVWIKILCSFLHTVILTAGLSEYQVVV